GRGELRRRARNLAVGGLAPGSGVRDDAVRYEELADRHFPLVGRGLQQHDARRGAAATHVVLRTADATAAAGRHVAPDALAGEILVGIDVQGAHLAPVALQLLGDELREAGVGALAHLRARDADHAAAVGPYHHPGVHFRAGGALCLRRADPK